MKTMRVKINVNDLREAIRNEILVEEKKQQIDPDAIRDVVNAASKLLKAVHVFNEKANETMKSALLGEISKLSTMLESMVNNPSNYTDKRKIEPKRIKLRRVEEAKKINENSGDLEPLKSKIMKVHQG